ncbi:hypothetical protein [Hoeflea prorocentri]|uniref:Uncharacterized protein n=1 Tax=Hoeflea prorocentri TaxID=1922333 RepID=A0A9X3UL24_9HYPH|nr:hypothetical protein [Hoeflea prorocentri]MCY6382810.1 hypothetical protein [Hoeflea prorocentri]MDA5400610.1 hypothetical protein [Hoeflea prorocentri]
MIDLTFIRCLCPVAVIAVFAPAETLAEEKSRIPPRELYQTMLDANRQSGWVQFRNFSGSQWIYFTALQTLHCRLSEIRYSINSTSLDKRFALVDCNPQNPMALPPDAGPEAIALRFAPDTAQSIAVQVVWEDGSESDVAIYEPCDNVGEQSCAWPK